MAAPGIFRPPPFPIAAPEFVTPSKPDAKFWRAVAQRWTRSKPPSSFSKMTSHSTRARARISIATAASNSTPSSWTAPHSKPARSPPSSASKILFARENGVALCEPSELLVERERTAWQSCREKNHSSEFHFGHKHGTVGAVARDAQGGIVAATSTGGTCCKFPGRVGDSPLIGCGCYADAEAGGISCTGDGEAIMKIVMAKTAADMLRGNAFASVHGINNNAAQSDVVRADGTNEKHNFPSSSSNPQSVADQCISLLA